MYFPASTTFLEGKERARIAALHKSFAAILEADTPPDIAALARRDLYPVAAAFFRAEVKAAGFIGCPIRLLWESPGAQPYRAALAFAVVRLGNALHATPFLLDDLRHVAGGRNAARRRRAKLALALLGECQWSHADRATRAAFVLGELVRGARR